MLDGGRIVAEGTVEELKRQVAGERLDLRLFDAEAAIGILALTPGTKIRDDPYLKGK